MDFSRKTELLNMLSIFDSQDSESDKQTLFLKTSKKRALLRTLTITSAYRKSNKIIYAGVDFPKELLLGFKLSILDVETIPGLFSKSEKYSTYFKGANSNFISKDICTNTQSTIGLGLADCLPYPNIIIGNSAPCNTSFLLSKYLSEHYKCKFLVFNTPHTLSENNIGFVAEQLKNVVTEIELELGIAFDEEKFMQAIRYSNESKEIFLKTVNLCRDVQLPLVEKELYEILTMHTWGTKEVMELCQSLYEEALQLAKENEQLEKKSRLIWYGHVPTYEGMIEYLEKNADVIYYSCHNSALFNLIDENDPYNSLAKRLILDNYNPIERANDIVKNVKEYHVDGVLFHNNWGCKNMCGTSSIIRNIVTKEKIKFLSINSDTTDKSKASFSQIKNRLDTFIEIM